jgi:hypothetical protein
VFGNAALEQMKLLGALETVHSHAAPSPSGGSLHEVVLGALRC